MSVEEWVTLIGAVAAAVVTIINGVRLGRKLEVIHQDTNGNLTAVKAQLAAVKQVMEVRAAMQERARYPGNPL